jgi:phosphoribosyl-ATP pyrophosphohydrolase
MAGQSILTRIYDVVLERKKEMPPDSYTASLFRQGEDAILKKVAEEASEVILASKSKQEDKIVHEVSDTFFHLLVLLGYHKIPPGRIFGELERRFGISGNKEKHERKTETTEGTEKPSVREHRGGRE